MIRSFFAWILSCTLSVVLLSLVGCKKSDPDIVQEQSENVGVQEDDVSQDGEVDFDRGDFVISIKNMDPQSTISVGVSGYSGLKDSSPKYTYEFYVGDECKEKVKIFKVGYGNKGMGLKSENCTVGGKRPEVEISSSEWEKLEKFSVYYMYDGGGRGHEVFFCKKNTSYILCDGKGI
ncbi:hypothetical protein KIF53_01340 [Chromobacterium subtsugae]|uniref:Lipoprotein n=1 Tax=Chromobacterium subtsugae TaxID=251747 RepID=A0ABS7F866_9NEIS|nr:MULTISPECIES: hypothetical protein [Chromobacterium]MBW7565192.1 hypothetical protein [Chromobacterium subtsugae]MBW8286280.1 hypothetical protein [Chromobacterium subtsugae]WSE91669.1 hypothetical protein U6115_00090 [Chromobacterium subtsugae]WVH60044.1 hypothetical protein U6151_00090 [Chromobacterium subtsugae]